MFRAVHPAPTVAIHPVGAAHPVQVGVLHPVGAVHPAQVAVLHPVGAVDNDNFAIGDIYSCLIQMMWL